MKPRIILSLLVIIVTYNFSCSQSISKGDSLLIKLVLLSEGLQAEGIDINKAMLQLSKIQLSYEIIDSHGFDNLIFLAVVPTFSPSHELPILGSNCSHFIIGIHRNGGLVYKIKGFAFNEPEVLFVDWKREIIPRRKFLKEHWIQEIDLECMYDAWKKNSFDSQKYPCLEYCLEMSVIR